MKKVVMIIVILSVTKVIKASGTDLSGSASFAPEKCLWGTSTELATGPRPYSTFVPGMPFHPTHSPASMMECSPCFYQDPRDRQIQHLSMYLHQMQCELAVANEKILRLSGFLADLQEQTDRLNKENDALKKSSTIAQFLSVTATWGHSEWTMRLLPGKQKNQHTVIKILTDRVTSHGPKKDGDASDVMERFIDKGEEDTSERFGE